MAGSACQRGTVLGPGAEGPEAGQSRGAAFPPGGPAVGSTGGTGGGVCLGKAGGEDQRPRGAWSRLPGAVRTWVTEQHMCPRSTEGQETQPGEALDREAASCEDNKAVCF